ncbi:uncharacterized protein FIBRA_01793 [Fibroporia radiculosa]|uniref:DUF6533 domain-containing protein n=1 Tax=Fibroporia radiculosa TaxID=599839 RepID=J4I8P5_9APHY|nr:uncharacterized protein FIBRA_01793 [Fibroporia radiculosa]CCL99771.1 predicted protein [Fibroporia radiculosa]
MISSPDVTAEDVVSCAAHAFPGMDFPDLLNDYRIVRNTWLLSLAILLYDHALTLSLEFDYAWRRRFDWTRLPFWVNRYWPLVQLLFGSLGMSNAGNVATRTFNIPVSYDGNTEHTASVVSHWLVISSRNVKLDMHDDRCRYWLVSLPYISIPTCSCMSAILASRIYAMYGCNRQLLKIMVVTFGLQVISDTVVGGVVFDRLGVMPLPPSYTGCIPSNIQSWFWVYWVPKLVFQTGVFAITAFKFVQELLDTTKTPHIMTVLLRDSALYFICSCSLVIANLYIWKTKPSLFLAAIPITTALNSIMGCRMLYNIQEAFQEMSTFCVSQARISPLPSQSALSRSVAMSSLSTQSRIDEDKP